MRINIASDHLNILIIKIIYNIFMANLIDKEQKDFGHVTKRHTHLYI